MKKQHQQIAMVAIVSILIILSAFHFGLASTILGDLTTGKQIIVDCEQTLSAGQSKDIYQCLQSHSSPSSVGDLYILGLSSYSGMQIPSITSIMCYKVDGNKEWIEVKSGGKTWRNYVTSGERNPYDNSNAMTSMSSGGKIIYMRFDGCIGTSGTVYSVACPRDDWTDCRQATATNIKVWIPLSAQTSVKCMPGWTETETCWDGSTVVKTNCVDYQKVSTRNKCPTEPETPPSGGTTPPTVCSPAGSMANARWNTATCSWVCNADYEMVGGVCQIISSSGGTVVAPPPPTQDDTILWVIAGILFFVIIGLAIYVMKIKR